MTTCAPWHVTSMSLPSWVKLRFGPYHHPRFRLGDRVLDLRRGQVTIAGLTNAHIQWPFYRTPVL